MKELDKNALPEEDIKELQEQIDLLEEFKKNI